MKFKITGLMLATVAINANSMDYTGNPQSISMPEYNHGSPHSTSMPEYRHISQHSTSMPEYNHGSQHSTSMPHNVRY